jgi:sulfur-carrier protein
MEIRFFASIRELTGEIKTSLAPPETVAGLLGQLSSRYGRRFEQRVFPDQKLDDTIIVLLNGRDIRHLSGVSTPLGPDDVVSIFPVVAGGLGG